LLKPEKGEVVTNFLHS